MLNKRNISSSKSSYSSTTVTDDDDDTYNSTIDIDIDSDSTIDNNSYKKNKKKTIIIIIIIMMMIMIIIIIILLLLLYIKENEKEEMMMYRYKMLYYNNINGEKIIGEINDQRNVRSFMFIDEKGYGNGYIYPIYPIDSSVTIQMSDEYIVDGDCDCCVGCTGDDDCIHKQENPYCIGNICVKCRNDIDCNGNEICSHGNCVPSYECRDDLECKEGERCFYGECGKGCRTDNNCGIGEICDWNGFCVEGCKTDFDCRHYEKCVEFRCSSFGCKNNFDCNDYDTVCINDYCVMIDDQTETCLDDKVCSNGYYCNYEYLICVKIQKETQIYRRNIESASVCVMYGVINMVILSSSYLIATNLAKEKLEEDCKQKCSKMYHASSKSTSRIKNIRLSKRNSEKMDSECNGKCSVNRKLRNKDLIDDAEYLCPTKELTRIITAKEKITYLNKHQIYNSKKFSPSHNIFRSFLAAYCNTFKHGYWYYHKNGKARMWKTPSLCSSDKPSIQCHEYEG